MTGPRTQPRWLLAALGVALTGVALTGCAHDPLEVFLADTDGGLSPDEDAHLPDGTGGWRDGSHPRTDACLPTAEICDGEDNDCNGVVDDVDPSHLAADPRNCGACNNVCEFPNAFAECVDGKCRIKNCAPGYHNIDGKDSTGCEYACVPSNDGKEECPPWEPDCACDGLDNDCDGQIDEVFDKSSDVNNCGACGNRCLYSNATGACINGKCQMTGCLDGYVDLNNSDKDGCEYRCPVWPPAADDPCDGIDNNCDGVVDEDHPQTACGIDIGECQTGTSMCVAGEVVCVGSVGPTAELCNNKDDDCDGVIDNGFDKQNDPRYCGPSCVKCELPHALAKCVAGQCAIAVCEQGWVDLNGQPGDGCEYQCTITGPEICDGLDNDCDGLIDTADPDMAALSFNPCRTIGACAGATASCQGAQGWVCNYSSDVELLKCTTSSDCGATVPCVGGVCPGVVAFEETRCDGKDNNCNGQIDELFTNKGQPCAEAGKQGICQGTGSFVCSADGTGTVCQITSPGQPATAEVCNGLDDDCDGLVDNDVIDPMVHVNHSGLDFYIYAYEASRPDATATAEGTRSSRACSKYNVRPWSSVTYAQAAAACAAAGKRLCTAAEWYAACAGDPATIYPYGDVFADTHCNGQENGVGAALPAGAKPACVSAAGALDLSGNLREWTFDPIPNATDPLGYTVRGGGYDTPEPGQRCDDTFVVMPPGFAYPNLGFRCCADAPD